MKQRLIILLLPFLIVIGYKTNAQDTDARANTPVPFTLADRDRIMRTELGINALEKRIDERFDAQDKRFDAEDKRFDAQDKRFDAQDKRFDAIQNQMNILFGFLFLILGGVMSLIAFVIYDRRTILKPVNKKQNDLETVLIKYSRKDKDLRELLQKAGIL